MTFIRDFADVAVDFETAAAVLLHADRAWLAPLAAEGVHAGNQLRLRVAAPGSAIPLPSKRVRIDLESPYRRGDAWVIPFHWQATGLPALFPQMEAELQVEPLGPGEVRLTLSGHYRPPLGEIGHMADAVLLHRVVERSVRVFLAGVAEGVRLSQPQGSHAVTRAAGDGTDRAS